MPDPLLSSLQNAHPELWDQLTHCPTLLDLCEIAGEPRWVVEVDDEVVQYVWPRFQGLELDFLALLSWEGEVFGLLVNDPREWAPLVGGGFAWAFR